MKTPQFTSILAVLALASAPSLVTAQSNTFPSSGNVGIGTANPSYLLDVAGNGRFSGPLTLTGQNPALNLSSQITNPSWGTAAYIYNNINITSNGTYYPITTTGYTHQVINAGVRNNGYLMGFDGGGWRSDPSDAGSLATIFGMRLQFGHYYTLNGSAHTDTMIGLDLEPYYQTGTVGNVYGLLIGGSSGATVTGTVYGICQTDSNAKNGFSGNVGIGTMNPSAKLQVVGGQIIGTSGSGADTRTLTILSDGKPQINHGPYPGAWTAALQIQNNDNGRLLWLSPLDSASGVNARIRSAATGLDIYTGGTTLDNGNLGFSQNAAGNVGIGTTGPGQKFTVAGGGIGMAANSQAYPGSDDGTGANPAFVINGNFSGGDGEMDFWETNPNLTGGFRFLQKTGASSARDLVRILGNGNVGIGTTSPTYPLTVNGTVRAKEVIVDTGWSDYVFDPGYRLQPLSEVEGQIKGEGHLPGIPSAKEVNAAGISVGDMQARLLAKVEELTLHLIQQEKRMQLQDARIQRLEEENQQLRKSNLQ